ncbi:pyridoxal phosphate-dependent aminotransferase [Desulfolutivibrio sulfoxidireducens]|uniref:pyridoxal phosphate-dependent aminotransferase n=1 Tax=Desulfolutivibrio sulfoxidireducens TaxID=2773299 RepID=UPI00159DB0FB|nr:pyridoxal phosphate-dependent aminotransferase [Desulfolutivibrio sulfoxidireducens]QLA14744.1 aminotransferase class I/II-fold pyridoxal phosphate-dependent enzyme [Desulfolutivibrio sulfoxidireducens]
MLTALRMNCIKPSATLAMSAKAKEMKAAGRRVLDLSVGEPDFPTPSHVKEAAKAALDADFTRYTAVPGIPELRAAIAGYFKRFWDVTAPPEATMATNGGKQALYNLLMAYMNPGDEALIPAPYWVSYPDMVRLAGAEPVAVPTTAHSGFKVTVEALEKARTPKTTLLILNSPSNPTGCHHTQAELDAIAAWAFSRDVFILSDEIYDQLVYEPAKPASMAGWWAKRPEMVGIANGLAKSFSMTGWRLGYCLAHPDLIKAMAKLQGQSTSNVCSFVQKAAVAALTGPYDAVDAMRRAFVRRRDLALRIIKTWDRAVCPTPQGAFYLFPDLSGYFTPDAPDSTALCAKIMDKTGVVTVPGAAFGDDACLRLSYATDDASLEQALTLMGRVLMG